MVDAHEDFAVGEVSDRRRLRVFLEDLSDFGRQGAIGPPGKEQKRTSAKRVVHGSQLGSGAKRQQPKKLDSVGGGVNAEPRVFSCL